MNLFDMFDSEAKYILYFDNKPVSTYSSLEDAEYQARLVKQKIPNVNFSIKQEICKLHPVELKENLRNWFKEKWVRFGPDGKIRGDCARGDDSEGKPKCLPQAKAHALGKKGRASAAARKRREDPNPERSGKAINVDTKKKSNEGVAEGFKNTYSAGDRVDSPLGTGTIVDVSKNVNVDGKVKVKLDDPSRAGDDGKERDTFVLTTTMLKHLPEQGAAEDLNEFALGDGDENILKNLAREWVEGDAMSGDLESDMKSQEKVEHILQNGVMCPDGVVRKLNIDWNENYDGVVIFNNNGDWSIQYHNDRDLSESGLTQGVAKKHLDELKCWPGYTRVKGVPAGAPGSCKKKTSEDVSEGMTWSSLDSGMSVEDKISVFEEFYTKGNLIESVNDDKKEYFASLFNMSSSPVKGKKYIVVPLSLVGNRIIPLDKPLIAEFVSQSNDGLSFITPSGEKTYPSKTMRDLSIFNTFTFSSTGVYDKFRTALSLKFDISLPTIGKDKKQGVVERKCPHCSGPLVEFSQLNEKKDACYYKVKSRYKVWPSAYASGALVKCRKKGAKNWGSKNESIFQQTPADELIETVDVEAIHNEALREHLLSDPALYENRDDFQNLRKFLDTHQTHDPIINNSYIYASVRATPITNFINIAYFSNKHELVKLDNKFAYFNINGVIKRFPEIGSISGDAMSQIYFFDSEKDLNQFITLLQLKFFDYKQTAKTLDNVEEEVTGITDIDNDIKSIDQGIQEDDLGVEPKRSPRKGSRHARGHEPIPRYRYIKNDEQVQEGRQYYDVIGTPERHLRSQFKMHKDSFGWYLNEDASKTTKLEALRAFGIPTKKFL